MISRRLAAAIGVQAVAVAGGVLAYVAWRSGLHANALLAAVVSVAAATASLGAGRDLPRPDPSEPSAAHLEDERRRRPLHTYLSQTPTPLLAVQADRPLFAVNRAARRMFRTDDVLADPAGELGRAILAASPDQGRAVRLEAGGTLRTYALSVADVVGSAGAQRLAALTDIEAEIQAAEAAALKELLQILGHEIMNSLTPLASLAQSAAELLADGAPEQVATARESVEVIARRADGLHRFVEAYRQLARLPEPSFQVVSLGGLLDEAAQLFETRWRAEGLVLRLSRPSPDVMMRLDPDLTAQALINLLTNAAEAALSGRDTPPTVWLSGQATGDGAVLSVEDNGPGVEASVAEEIFRPFFTTKSQGNGVGLSFARQAVASQGGRLTATARLTGQGARFVMSF